MWLNRVDWEGRLDFIYVLKWVSDFCTALTRHWFFTVIITSTRFAMRNNDTTCFTLNKHYELNCITGWKVGISLTGLTLPPWCACSKFVPGLPTSFVSWTFCVQWFQVRCGCLFCWCWCWWNCWPSLYDFLFSMIWS
jgi:hypothetical protein